MIDTEVTVARVWRKSGMLLTNSSRMTIPAVEQLSSSVYISTLTIFSLSSVHDSGSYSCEVSIGPNPPSTYIFPSLGTASKFVHIEGIVGIWCTCSIANVHYLLSLDQLLSIVPTTVEGGLTGVHETKPSTITIPTKASHASESNELIIAVCAAFGVIILLLAMTGATAFAYMKKKTQR